MSRIKIDDISLENSGFFLNSESYLSSLSDKSACKIKGGNIFPYLRGLYMIGSLAYQAGRSARNDKNVCRV
jgi:hypothetical protein